MWEKPAMSPIDQMKIDSLLRRALGQRMRRNILRLSEEDSVAEVIEIEPDKWATQFLIARWEVHDLSLLMDFTGNIDAPLP